MFFRIYIRISPTATSADPHFTPGHIDGVYGLFCRKMKSNVLTVCDVS